MADYTYFEQRNIYNTTKLRNLLSELPPFCGLFFRGIEPSTSSLTRIAYAYDLQVFFNFLHNSNPVVKDTPIREINVEILDQIKAIDIEEYLEYLTYYRNGDAEHLNGETGKKRKLISLRSFYNYFFKKEIITTNPASLVDIPKLHEKEIIRLDIDEIAKMLDYVETGEKLTKTQLKYHELTKTRDLALITLLLGTGIRVSECVGLDINNVDFNNDGIKIKRKGGSESVIYFGEEVRESLESYLVDREKIIPEKGSEDAVFLSMQKKRMSVKAVENMVKKYSVLVTQLKNITPHKLRSTYGTNLYQETGDIYLVADVLGHKDVNTTKKHYAALEDSRRRSAARVVKLRRE